MNGGGGRSWPRVSVVAALVVSTALVVVLAPFGTLVSAAAQGSTELWSHLVHYVLPAAVADTLVLLLGVGSVTVVVGTGLAWVVTAFDFPGRRLIDGALLLPLAVPTYIVAYAYLDILHPIGPVQESLRWVLGYDSPRDFRLPDVRSMAGCIAVLGFVLYPYVYLPVRALFAMQSAALLDASRTLGLTGRQAFLHVAVPLARPAIALGLSLALMETLNDIGAAEFLGIRTLTVSIYATWVTRSDLAGATQIALAMLSLVLAMVALERWARCHQRYVNDAQHPRPIARRRLGGAAGATALLCALAAIGLGFVVPAAYLAHAAWMRVGLGEGPATLGAALRATVLLAVGATLVTSIAGLAVAYALRLLRLRSASPFMALLSIGYATPGTVVALAILPTVIGLDRATSAVAQALTGTGTGLLLLGSGAAVVYAYAVRFLAIALGGVESALSKIPASLDEAGATLGAGPGARLRRVHLPLMNRAVMAASVLIFVDCMKELPATLLLRPLGVETLATLLYGEAARGTYENGALAALLIVAVGVLPVWLLNRLTDAQTSNASLVS